ncbi:interleukin-3 receptor subunit alpha isoform X1 [Marmota monax]|uniref:interleukin-3 receptor subunit alpha isoform X1 n=1 Tax=Marmota monax TaxID=9995 RepID=UPI001EB00AC8|nr:interleukin-3 receptor subunit alpha isoform X1 [Marmota monax]XP_046299401.1 interleukin-3 receptor subunit alpha isoform X1 [Marmota monax]
MGTLWLLMFLTPASCLLDTTQAGDIAGPEPPIRNLRMDAARSHLTWDVSAPSSTIYCVTDSDHIQEAQDGTYCRYETLSLCTVTNYTVTVDQPPFATWILFPEPDENPGTAPANLDCWVHDVDFMSCEWAVGRTAPGDVQYRLYWKDAREYRECGHYQTDSRGRHVGCRFSGISKYPRSFVVMVNGTSALSAISCRDCFADLYEIERLSPPNITAKCNKTSSLMEWRMFSHFNKNFKYQLQVNKSSGGSFNETIPTNHFLLPNPGNYKVRIRVKDNRNFYSSWSPWGAPQSFQCDPDEDRPSRILQTSLLAAAGTLAIALLGLFLCKRLSLMQRLFPPVPRVKATVCDHVPNGEMLALETAGDDCPVAQVQDLEEP